MKLPMKYIYRNVWVRRRTAFFALLGMALVIFVYSAVLMLATGLKKTLVDTGDDNNAIVVRKSANSELVSSITREQANVLKSMPGIVPGKDGKPLVASELVVVIGLNKIKGNVLGNVIVRGVSPESVEMRTAVHVVRGRTWSPGSSEVIVGSAIAKRFQGCELGQKLKFGQREWEIVGVFEANHTGFESEIWGDGEQMMPAFRRPVFSTLTARLESPAAFAAFKENVEKDKRLLLETKPEKKFYAEQSQFLGLFIQILGTLITIIFSVGAMIGATITLYASVANRTREIGTLRAIGFSRGSVLWAFLLESVVTALVGGGMGLACATVLGFYDLSTTNFTSFSEIEFGFTLTRAIALQCLIFSLVMGVVGGFLPAVAASRLKIVEALRRG